MSATMYPQTLPARHDRIFSTFQTAASYTAPAPVAAKPTAGVMPNTPLRNQIIFTPVGVGDAGQTVEALLIGWVPLHALGFYIPIELLRVTGTLGNTTAVIGADTVRFCDTLTIEPGEGAEGTPIVVQVKKSQGGIAYVLIDNPGLDVAQFQVSKGTATSANVLAGTF